MGNIGHEGGIGRVRIELPRKDIFGNREGVIAVSGVDELALPDRLEARSAHQAAGFEAANVDALCSQGADQTPAAVALLAGGEGGLQVVTNLA